jgi:hypothetical protein
MLLKLTELGYDQYFESDYCEEEDTEGITKDEVLSYIHNQM